MRLINADEATKEILDVYEYEYPTASGAFDHFVTHMVPNILRNLPTVDAEPVRRGQWIYKWFDSYCSVCGWENKADTVTRIRNDYPYCPHCGAKMDE